MKRISIILLLFCFFSVNLLAQNTDELYEKVLNYIDQQYYEHDYVSLYFPDIFEYASLYYDYVFYLFQLCIDVFGENSNTIFDYLVREYKEKLISNEFVEKIDNFEIELKKSKQFEIYEILKQYLKQHIEHYNKYCYQYYKEKIDVMLLYVVNDDY